MRRTIPSLILVLSLATARAQFGPPIPVVEVGSLFFYSAFTMEDVDADGDQDLLLGADGKLTLRLNRGDGYFDPHEQVYQNAAGIWPTALAFGDMDGDGDLDIVQSVESAITQQLRWLRKEADGTYSAGTVINNQAPYFTRLQVVDIEPDGDLDVIGTNGPGAYVYRNTGTGLFGAPQVVGSGSFRFAAAGDLDQDGDLDLVASSGGGSFQVSLWDGSTYASPLQVSPMVATGIGSQVVDVNGDGFLDAVIHTAAGFSCKLNLGGGALGPVQSFSIPGGQVLKGQLADVNGDGAPDFVAVTAEDRVWWMLNDGAGGFAAATLAPGEMPVATSAPTWLEVKDIDGDGLQDALCIGNVDGRLFKALDGGALAAPRFILVNSGAYGAEAADMDGDGDKDILVGGAWVEQLAPGRFGPVHSIGESDAIHAGADLDGDGLMDATPVYRMSDSLVWRRNMGDGTFEKRMIDPAAWYTYQAQAVDLDGDGDLDILRATGLALRPYLNQGDGTFAPTYSSNAYAEFFACGDFDGDGDTDIIGNESNSNTDVVVFRHDPAAESLFESTQYVATINNPEASQAIPADFNGDGRLDVLFRIGNAIRWYRNNPNGTWTNQLIMTGVRSVQLGDVNADGRPDLLYEDSNGLLSYRLNSGTGTFAAAVQLPLPDAGNGRAVLTDIDNDGDDDILAKGYLAAVVLLNYTINPGEATGTLFIDADADGSRGPDDPATPFLPVAFSPDQGYVFTDGVGGYSLRAAPGTYTVTAPLPSGHWALSTDSASYTFTFGGPEVLHDSLDFGFAALVDTTDVEAAFSSAHTRCGSTIQQWVSLMNRGTQPEQGYVRLLPDPLLAPSMAVPPPDSIANGAWFWGFNDLQPFEMRTIVLTADVPGFQDAGTVLRDTVQAIVLDEQGTAIGTSTYAWSSTITCAYDPNDKQVEPVGFGNAGAVEIGIPEFRYTVRFQNTGTDTALTVVIRDPLDADLDPATLRILGASHTLTGLSVDNAGVAFFRFEGIMLPDSNVNEPASHGFVRFAIAPHPNRPHGTQVHNSVGIYFDQNPPISTNTVVNTLVDCTLFNAGIGTGDGVTLIATSGVAFQWFLDGEPIAGATAQTHQAAQNGAYTVQVTSAFGCMATSAPYSVISTGGADLGHAGIEVYPNPGQAALTVEAGSALGPETLFELFDMQGRTVFSARGNGGRRMSLAVAEVARGSYLLRVVQGEAPILITQVVLH